MLLVGYVSRFTRNLRDAMNARHSLHSAGAAVLFCGERLLTSDEDTWKQWADETADAEVYSRKLGKRIREGFAAKYRRGDQAGTTPLGFRRQTEPPRLLEIDPATIGQAVALFTEYATGTHSFTSLGAAHDMAPERVREILAAPIFNGWFRHGKRAREERRTPAPWRADPPVPDVLWDRVQEVRRAKAHGGGPHRWERVDPLAGLLYCTCGRHIKANGTSGNRLPTRVHPDPCGHWGRQAGYPALTWLQPLAAQVQQLRLDGSTIAQVVRALRQPAPRADELARQRLQRRRKKLAEEYALGSLSLGAFLAALDVLDGQEKALLAMQAAPPPVDAQEAVDYLRDLPRLWADAGEKERADLLHAIYQRVEVRGAAFVGVTLTPAAEAHGLALALPETIALARPAGIEPAT